MARRQIDMEMSKLTDDTVTFVHTNLNKASQSKANSFGLRMYTVNDHNHQTNIDF